MSFTVLTLWTRDNELIYRCLMLWLLTRLLCDNWRLHGKLNITILLITSITSIDTNFVSILVGDLF